MTADEMKELLAKMQKPASVMFQDSPQEPREAVPEFELDDDGEEYMGVGVNGVLAASEKLKAINKGLVDQDERDSLRYQKVFRPHSMFREGIKMDAGKVGRQIMYRAARSKNLKGLMPAAFDSYIERVLIGNPLTSPLEEINPMQLVENARRITKMGPGGLGSSRSITEESQSIHPSQFGFISVIEGPECFALLPDTKVFTSEGWVPIDKVTLDHKVACRINDRLEFHNPERIVREHYKGPMYGTRNMNLSFCVTPNHRFYGCYDPKRGKLVTKTAEEIYGKIFKLPCAHKPYIGEQYDKVTFSPDGEHTYDIKDWCALLGWFLAEGNLNITHTGYVQNFCISQSEDVHPDEFGQIDSLLTRMGVLYSYKNPAPSDPKGYKKRIGFSIRDKHLKAWFSQYNHGCYHKWIPEDVFEWSVEARQALLDALMAGDGRVNDKHFTYCTVSKKLAEDVERLMIGLGYCVTMRTEKDAREHVKTTNYAVCGLKTQWRHTETPDKRYAPYWYKKDHDDFVYCLTVPGGMFYFSCEGRPGCWTGNSERAGIDVRITRGVRIGSNGRLYQKMRDRRTGKLRWMSPKDLDGLTTKIPD